MKLVITTQCRENYGAHEWDGEGECPQRWKMKFGETYVVPNLDISEMIEIVSEGVTAAQSLVEQLRPLIEDFNDGYEEYIIDWNLLDDDIPPCPEWETPWTVEWNGTAFEASRCVPKQDYWQEGYESKNEHYIMLEGGGSKNYTCIWATTDGRFDINEVLTNDA